LLRLAQFLACRPDAGGPIAEPVQVGGGRVGRRRPVFRRRGTDAGAERFGQFRMSLTAVTLQPQHLLAGLFGLVEMVAVLEPCLFHLLLFPVVLIADRPLLRRSA
jgi:hypothetical protein